MAYDDYEISQSSGEPVELFYFQLGPRQWRLTSADEIINANGFEWLPVYVQGGGFSQGSEINRSNLTVSLQGDHEIVKRFLERPPESVMSLTVYRLHRNDVDKEAIVFWLGRVLTAGWEGPAASLHCEPIYSSMKRSGLKRHYQSSCPWQLYGSSCGVLRDSYRNAVTVSAISGRNVEVVGISSAPDGFYAGGFMQLLSTEGDTYYRMILAQTGDVLTLEQVPSELKINGSIDIFPGCNHTLEACEDRFNNILNYGGMPGMPSKNPFKTMVY